MKFGKKGTKVLSFVLVLAMVLGLTFGMSLMTFAKGDRVTRTYGDFTFNKISNPTAGPKQPDGINTNDETGFPANRLNSYAWAVVTRGDYIYIGTNRTLFGSAVNAVAERIQAENPNLTPELLGNIVSIVTGGDVPVNLKEEDYIPQIIRFDVRQGTTKVIYQPKTKRGEDGILYYTDKDGNIIPNSDVTSETASFRSVIEFKGNLYFGSLGTNMLQLVRIDENDNADVVFQTLGLISSLRAGCVYDDGTGETVYSGGQDTTYYPWLEYRATHLGDPVLPIVIRRLDPATAGTDAEDWNGLVADFNDFGQYARASVYSAGGGNVWDLCSFNGKLYLILAYDGGWALFRGEKGGANPNQFGWTWTEVVGDNGKYPLAMNSKVAELNKQYETLYGCGEYTPALIGSGLLESTATPYVYNGKMYIGSFDNATTIQSETVIKVLVKLAALTKAKETGDFGPSLTQIFAPIYEVMSHPQHVWVMDENENIVPADSLNKQLEGTTNDYVWRFIEHNGKLYTGTFDSSTAFNYFVDYTKDQLIGLMEQNKPAMPEHVQELLDGNFSTILGGLMDTAESAAMLQSAGVSLRDAAMEASKSAEGFFDGKITVEQLLGDMTDLQTAKDELLKKAAAGNKLTASGEDSLTAVDSSVLSSGAGDMIEWLLKFIDIEGLIYWAKARAMVRGAEQGFDIFMTEDGTQWQKVTGDGAGDPYNYGARTFTIWNNDLFVGTANPYYGGQLWMITGEGIRIAPVVTKKPAAKKLSYTGKAQELVTAGESEGGLFVYSLDNDTFSAAVPKAKKVGTYKVYWQIVGDSTYKDYVSPKPITVKITKGTPVIKVKTTSKAYKATALQKSAQTFSLGASVNSKGTLSYKVTKYSTSAKKYLSLNAKTGKVTVKKGTPKGTYALSVKISAKATSNYNAGTKTVKVTVTVK